MYIIRSVNEKGPGDCPLYWNEQQGWVARLYATVYTTNEMEKYMWMPVGGEWIDL